MELLMKGRTSIAIAHRLSTVRNPALVPGLRRVDRLARFAMYQSRKKGWE
jgi:hypothetical protein